MDSPPSAVPPPCAARFGYVFWGAWLAAALLVFPVEALRFAGADPRGGPLAGLIPFNVDTTPFLFWLILAPAAWWLRGGVWVERRDVLAEPVAWFAGACDPERPPSARTWIAAVLVAALACSMCAWVGGRRGDLPPAFHDEYSYRFQARTFLAGRMAFPSHPTQPRLFDQMHVVNDGRFASRYFPGMGAWLAPWLAGGRPYAGQWAAAALSALCLFAIGRQLAGDAGGLVAGLLTATSAGILVFHNTLLAHAPAMLGCCAFLASYLHWRRTGRTWSLAAAGIALTFAMLCRPMTAAGFALPCGLDFTVLWLRRVLWKNAGSSPIGLATPLALALPLALGFAILGWQNHAITGSVWRTAYSEYTATLTPRHVYGFHNAVRGARLLAGRTLPPVTRNYDAWAEDLTPARALRNVGVRLLASGQWTWGLVPLLMSLIVVAGVHWRDPDAARRLGVGLILAAIVSLHVVHVPYWFDGIFHWHYVFETAPLWLLIAALATVAIVRHAHAESRPWLAWWWGGMLATAGLVNLVSNPPWWDARLDAALGQLRFSGQKHAAFEQAVREQTGTGPALVLIEHDPADRHIEYVDNPPDLQARVLTGRFDPGETDLPAVLTAFPNRAIYLWHAADGRWEVLRP